MHARCSKDLVKDIKRYKVTGGRSESSPIRHWVLVAPSIFADEGRTPPGSPVALFLVLVRIGLWTERIRAFFVDLSKNGTGACRGVCVVGNRTLAAKCKCRTPIRQPLLASARVSFERCAESIP